MLTFESDQPLAIREIPYEGQGLSKTIIMDEWDFRSAGGCSNFGIFNKNPCYAIHITCDSDI